MRQPLFLFCVAMVLVCAQPSEATYVIPHQGIYPGGGQISNQVHRLRCTVGVSAPGQMEGSHILQGGFWYPTYAYFQNTPLVEFPQPLSVTLEQRWTGISRTSVLVVFTVPTSEHVSLMLYDVAGRSICRPVDEHLAPGRYSAVIDASALTSGIYFCRLRAGSVTQMTRLAVVK